MTSAPLTDYQVEVLAGNLKEHEQARVNSMEEAGYLATKLNLSDRTHTLIEDCRNDENRAFFIESKSSASFLRPFEREHKISAAIARARGEPA